LGATDAWDKETKSAANENNSTAKEVSKDGLSCYPLMISYKKESYHNPQKSHGGSMRIGENSGEHSEGELTLLVRDDNGGRASRPGGNKHLKFHGEPRRDEEEV
jgi:hypothetical protein